METFWILLQRMIVLLLIGLLGFFAKRRGILDEVAQQKAQAIMLKLGVPFAILSSVSADSDPSMGKNIVTMLIISAVAMLVFFLVAQLFCRRKGVDRADRAGIIMGLMFGNTLFVGLPLAEVLFGPQGIFYLSLFNLVSTVLTWTYGASVCQPSGRFQWKTMLSNPAFIASLFMVLLVLFQVPLPLVLSDTMSILGKMTTPLSMLLLGAMLAGMSVHEVFRRPISYAVTLVRLVVLPLALLFVIRLFGVGEEVMRIAAICVGLPAGSLNPSIVRSGGLNPATANSIAVLTTLGSVITIPIMMLYVNLLLALPVG